jgi:hypothetical protein
VTNDSEAEGKTGPSAALVISALGSGAGAAAGYQLGGPGGAAIGGMAVPFLVALFQKSANELWADRTGRAEEMLRSAGEAAGLDPDQFAEWVGQSPRTRFLSEAAIQAAADTYWPPGVRALGRALAAGLIQAEDAVIDIPKMVLPAMTEMVAPHVQLLDLLVMCRWDGALRREGPVGARRIDAPHNEHLAHIKSEWTAEQMTAALPSLAPVLGSVIGALERHGLIEQNDSTAEALTEYSKAYARGHNNARPRVINSIEAERIAPLPSWSPTALGEQVLGYYDLAAEAIE